MAEQQFVIRLGLNSDGVQKGVTSAVGQVQRLYGTFEKLGNIIGGVRGGVLGAVAIGIFSKLKGELSDISERVKEIDSGVSETGLDPTAYQGLANTLKALGINAQIAHNSLEATAAAVEKIRNKEDSNGSLTRSFATLGVTLDQIKKQNHQQVWLAIGNAMRGLPTNTATLNALQAVAGGKAGDLIPAFRRGLDGGPIITEDELARVRDYNRNVGEMKLRWQSFKNEVGLTMTKLALFFTGGSGNRGDALGISLESKLAEKLVAKAQAQAELEIVKAMREKNDLKEKEIRLSRMSASQRDAELMKERAVLQSQMNGLTGVKAEELRTKILDIEAKMSRETGGNLAARGLSGDSLSRMGIFVGGRGNATYVLQSIASEVREQRRIQSAQQSELRNVVQRLDNIREEIRN